MPHLKLHIPGPIEVSEKTFQAMTQPMIGHRGKEFQDLYSSVQPRLQALFHTQRLVYLSTSSAWGVMEGSIRNLVTKKVLCCGNGAFSEKWYDVALRCGKSAEALNFDWGSPVDPAQVDARLATGEFDVVTLIHNETSTGTMSDINAVAALKKKYPDVMFVVDSVSSMSVTPIPFDELGLDVLLTGSQKALAMPPGLALFAVSEAALAKAKTVNDRGYYFDFVEFQNNAENSMTPSTPCISLIFGLQSKLEDIFNEGLEARYARHHKLAMMTRDWAQGQGFTLFPDPGYESLALTCINNGGKPGAGRVVDVAALQKKMRTRGFQIDGGYGKVKGKTFRLSSMGDETEETMKALYAALDESLSELS